MTKNFRMPWE